MGALKDRVTAQIVAQQAEIERVKATATVELANAQQRLVVLQKTATALTPQLEGLIDQLASVGVKVSIE